MLKKLSFLMWIIAIILVVEFVYYKDIGFTNNARIHISQTKTNIYRSLQETNDHGRQPLVVHKNQNKRSVVLASFYSSKKDPQRGVFVPTSYKYIRNFYTTVVYHNLSAIIMHDGLPEDLITTYTTENINFVQVDKRNIFSLNISINDFRFMHYSSFLQASDFDYVLLADISDTFFWHNPFVYMRNNYHQSLFLSSDTGTIGSNGWMVAKMRRCYAINSKYDKTPLLNDGLWGGKSQAVLCVLSCMTNQFHLRAIPNKNCNMAVMNWCIKFANCVPTEEMDTKTMFANPFRQNCDSNDFIVIHDKCRDSKQKCIYVENEQLVRKSCHETVKM